MSRGGLQPTATHALQRIATHCNALPLAGNGTWYTMDDCNILQCTHCNVLQHTATHCNTLQHIATHCNTLQYTATHCNTLQHTATRYNTLQHIATRCNTRQHTAVGRITTGINIEGGAAWHKTTTHAATHSATHTTRHITTHTLQQQVNARNPQENITMMDMNASHMLAGGGK